MYDYAENKIVAILAAELEPGVAMNVLGHLSVSLGAYADRTLMGRPLLLDASGTEHRGIARYPLIITKEKGHRLRNLLDRARTLPGVFIADYPEAMLSTGHDDDLYTAISTQPERDIRYLGAILFGPTSVVRELTGKLSLWR